MDALTGETVNGSDLFVGKTVFDIHSAHFFGIRIASGRRNFGDEFFVFVSIFVFDSGKTVLALFATSVDFGGSHIFECAFMNETSVTVTAQAFCIDFGESTARTDGNVCVGVIERRERPVFVDKRLAQRVRGGSTIMTC